jgi:hypothetical protein
MLLLLSTRGMSSLRILLIARIWSLGISIDEEWSGFGKDLRGTGGLR